MPANVPYVITVGALSDAGTAQDPSDDFMPSHSSAGPTLDDVAECVEYLRRANPRLEVYAPV